MTELKNGAGDFTGELILFGSEEYPNWQTVCAYLERTEEIPIEELEGFYHDDK